MAKLVTTSILPSRSCMLLWQLYTPLVASQLVNIDRQFQATRQYSHQLPAMLMLSQLIRRPQNRLGYNSTGCRVTQVQGGSISGLGDILMGVTFFRLVIRCRQSHHNVAVADRSQLVIQTHPPFRTASPSGGAVELHPVGILVLVARVSTSQQYDPCPFCVPSLLAILLKGQEQDCVLPTGHAAYSEV